MITLAINLFLSSSMVYDLNGYVAYYHHKKTKSGYYIVLSNLDQRDLHCTLYPDEKSRRDRVRGYYLRSGLEMDYSLFYEYLPSLECIAIGERDEFNT